MKTIYSTLTILLSSLLLQGCAGGFIAATGTVVSVASDDRSITQQIDDYNLSSSAKDTIITLNEDKDIMRVNVVTQNNHILLIGQVNSQANSNQIESAVSNLKEVEGVYNQLRVNKPINFSQQALDSWITTKIKSKFVTSKDINPLKIKVVTENSEVFLLGQVTEHISDTASNIASNVDGVEKVIKVFQVEKNK